MYMLNIVTSGVFAKIYNNKNKTKQVSQPTSQVHSIAYSASVSVCVTPSYLL